MNANEDTHAIFNQSNGIELTLVSPPTKGFRRSGVETTSQTREVFIALASLIRAGRHEMALAILDNELGGGC